MTSRLESMGDCPFELHERIKCDMLNFLKVSKVVSIFLKPTFNLFCKDFQGDFLIPTKKIIFQYEF